MKERAVKEWPERIDVIDGHEGPPDAFGLWAPAGTHDLSKWETRVYVPQQRVNALVEAVEELIAGSDELFARNRAKALREATVNARAALANYKEGEICGK